MKTFISEKRKAVQAVLSLMMLLGLAACPANNNDGNNGGGFIQPPGPVCPPGVNCINGGGIGVGGAALDKGLGQSASRDVSLALRFSAQGQLPLDGLTPYVGPYVAQGELQLTQGLQSCNIPPGIYAIQGVSQYPWQLGTTIIMNLTMSGPGGVLQIAFRDGIISNRAGGAIAGPNGIPYEKYVGGTLYIPCPSLYYPNLSMPITVGI